MAGLSDLLDTILGTGTEKEDAEAARLVRENEALYKNIALPKIQDLKLDGQTYQGDVEAPGYQAAQVQAEGPVEFGDTDARLAALDSIDGSAFEGIEGDPRLENKQYESLGALDEIIQGGGMTAADQANLSRVGNQAAQADKGRRDAILQNMQARGMGGGGMELLAQLQSSQAATDRQSQESMDVAGMAQQRALDAIMQSGQLSGQMRGQQFGEDSEIAAAKDAIAKFNNQNSNQNNQFNAGQLTGNDQFQAQGQYGAGVADRNYNTGVQQWNKGAINDASRFTAGQQLDAGIRNKNVQQGVADSGVDARNQSQITNRQAPRDAFNDKIAQASGQATTTQGAIDYQTAKAGQKAAKGAAITGAGITAATGGLNYLATKPKKPGEV